MEEMVRRESSVPAQSRVDIRTLAELCLHFETSGVVITTISQLISWSLEMMVGTLKVNEKLPNARPSVENAYEFLEARSLMQRGMRRKASKALGFEHMRLEGINPLEYAAGDSKQIHNNPNWSGGDMPAFNVPNKADLQDWIKKADEIKKVETTEDLKTQAKEQIEKIIAGSNVEEVNGVKVITPNETTTGVVTEEYMEERKEEQRKIDEEHEEEKLKAKEERAKERRKDTIQRNIDKLKGELNELEPGDEPASVPSLAEQRPVKEIEEERIRKDRKLLEDQESALDTLPTEDVVDSV